MDLRKFGLSDKLRNEAIGLLDYQPFIIDDNHCTGVAYTWLHAPDPRFAGDETVSCRYSKSAMPHSEYDKALECTIMLGKTYDSIVDEGCRLSPGGSFLDISCNNGYFPIRAALNGMSYSAGMDPVDRNRSFALLNKICRQNAHYIKGGYAFWQHAFARYNLFGRVIRKARTLLFADDRQPILLKSKFDVVTSSEFLCHVGEPLHFLYAISALARKVLIIYSGFLDDDDYLIRFNPPLHFIKDHFPSCFNDGTAISTKLFRESMGRLGFSKIYELPQVAGGMPENWHLRRMPRYGRHTAFVCVR